MAVSVTMPRLGESVTEGTVTRWLKKEGEQVEADEPLLEVSTDKVDTEIPAPAQRHRLRRSRCRRTRPSRSAPSWPSIDDGRATDAAAPRGGTPLQPPEPEAEPAEAAPEPATPEPEPAGRARQPRPGRPRPASAEDRRPAARGGRRPRRRRQPHSRARARHGRPATAAKAPYVTPLVRKLATEHGVDLARRARHRRRRPHPQAGRARRRPAVGDGAAAPRCRTRPPLRRRRRHGPGSRRRPGAPPAPRRPAALAPARDGRTTRAPRRCAARPRSSRRLRKVIAQRMVESLQVSAQLTTVVEVDVTRDRAAARAGEGDVRGARGREAVVPAVLRARRPSRRSRRTRSSTPASTRPPGTVTYHDGVHLGIAVDTDRGLLVPVIHGRRRPQPRPASRARSPTWPSAPAPTR